MYINIHFYQYLYQLFIFFISRIWNIISQIEQNLQNNI